MGSPAFSTRAPEILNSGGTVSFSLPIMNIGTGTASNVYFTEIRLGSATLIDPSGLPAFAGTAAKASPIFANARFSGSGLTLGQPHLIAVQGTYEFEGATYGFQVNRFVVIPPPVAPPVSFLDAQIRVEEASGVWSYTLSNDEAGDSPNFINAFSLNVVAPVTVANTPIGWQTKTDGASFVLWYAEDTVAPYPHHIAPGVSLVGFSIQSRRTKSEPTGFALTAWNHQTNKAGLVRLGSILSPSRTA